MILEKLNGSVLRILQREEMNRMIRGDCTVSVFFIWKGEKMGRGRKRLLGLQDLDREIIGAEWHAVMVNISNELLTSMANFISF